MSLLNPKKSGVKETGLTHFEIGNSIMFHDHIIINQNQFYYISEKYFNQFDYNSFFIYHESLIRQSPITGEH